MSMMNCVECGKPIDTDIDPDAFRLAFDDAVICDVCYGEMSDEAIERLEARVRELRDILTDRDYLQARARYWRKAAMERMDKDREV